MIVKALVDDTEAVDVREIPRNGATLIEIRVAPQDMGKVMGVATKKLAGQADGKMISDLVKKLLSP